MFQDEFAAYVAQQIKALPSQPHAPQFVAVSGRDCAGKSTLAIDVQEQLNRLGLTTTLLSIDTFLIPHLLRTPNASEFIAYFENTFDYAALVQTLESVRNSASLVDSNRRNIVLVEGVFLLRKELYHWWDFTVWIEVDTSVIMKRALRRDKQYFGSRSAVRGIYENRCLPAQDYHILRDLPKKNADITATFENRLWIVPEGKTSSEIDAK